jgi:hypothetical protein
VEEEKMLYLPIVGLDLLHQESQLFHQDQHQPSLDVDSPWVCLQLGLMELGIDPGGNALGLGMTLLTQQGS